jgi:hypothetical protein
VSANVEFLKKALLDGLSALERLEEERGLVPEEVRKGLVISVATHPNDTILSGFGPSRIKLSRRSPILVLLM